MPIDFPSSPTTGQVYTYQGKSWVYNGTGWDSPRALSEIGAVQTFENAAARTAAIPTPTEGIVSYLNDVDLLSIYESGAWRNSVSPRGGVLQVVSTNKTDTFTTTSATFTPVTGLSATITPKSTTSKILVLAQIAYGLEFNMGFGAFKITRSGNDVYRGDESSTRLRAVFGGYSVSDQSLTVNSGSINFLDSPSSTSALTYQVEVRRNETGTVYINRSQGDPDATNNNRIRGASSITLMEVSA
jgi:hypothetical protein